MFPRCSYAGMDMIRASDEELETVLHIAVTTAPHYVLRNVFERKFDRDRAVDVIVQRVFATLRNYELMRAPKLEEQARRPLPLFDEANLPCPPNEGARERVSDDPAGRGSEARLATARSRPSPGPDRQG